MTSNFSGTKRNIPFYKNMISITPKLNFTFIFLLIITLIGGSYMVLGHIGGVEISSYRFVLMVTTGYLILTKHIT